MSVFVFMKKQCVHEDTQKFPRIVNFFTQLLYSLGIPNFRSLVFSLACRSSKRMYSQLIKVAVWRKKVVSTLNSRCVSTATVAHYKVQTGF